jgi:hypothetical protein
MATSSKLDKLGLQVMNAARFQGRRRPPFLPEAKIALDGIYGLNGGCFCRGL